jgi:hypothetical protein
MSRRSLHPKGCSIQVRIRHKGWSCVRASITRPSSFGFCFAAPSIGGRKAAKLGFAFRAKPQKLCKARAKLVVKAARQGSD